MPRFYSQASTLAMYYIIVLRPPPAVGLILHCQASETTAKLQLSTCIELHAPLW